MTLKNYAPYLLIATLVILVCWPSLSGDFIFDDNHLIKNNSYIKDLHSLSSYLAQEDGIIDKEKNPNLHTGFYRPLLNFTYFLDFKLWGMNAHGFRLTNALLHLICSILIFQMLLYLKINTLPAFLGSVFFALHPTATESVSMIVCRNNLLVTIFCITSFMFYRISLSKRKWFLFPSSLFFGLGLFSKEVAVMLLPIIFLSNRFLSEKQDNWKQEAVSYMPFLAIVMVYFFLRAQVTGAFLSPIAGQNLEVRLLFLPYIITYNIFIIVLPLGLHSFYIQYPSSFFQCAVLGSYIIFVLLVIVLWKLRSKKFVLFSVSAFFVALFPVLNIVPMASQLLVTMRWVYFPLAFLTIAVAYSIQSLLSVNKIRFIAISGLTAILVYFAMYSYILNNTLWKDQRSFLQIEVLTFNNILFADTLAEVLQSERKYEEAEILYLASLKAFPQKAEIYINYSSLLIDTKRAKDAIEYLERSKSLIMTNTKHCQWLNNMGVACDRVNYKICALKHLTHAVQLCPDNANYRINLEIIKGKSP
jgi:tetratricopeptide (TPR) repeat protein